MDSNYKSISDLHTLLVEKKISSVELTRYFLDRIKKYDASINSFITISEEEALRLAQKADERLAKNNHVTALTGIPIALKDLIITKGIRTTCASRILSSFIPPYNATVTEQLITSGAVILGKLNMDEFAMGSSSENSFFGPVKNPWNVERSPGGSSGGSAAAVSAGLVSAALGSDTGGSIRLPSAFCGVTGLKPTYGRVSRFGLVAFASSLDQLGPIGRSAYDCAIILEAIAGFDSHDSTSSDTPLPPYSQYLNDSINGSNITIGIPKEYTHQKGLHNEIATALENTKNFFMKRGVKIKTISLPYTDYAVSTYYILATAEASTNLARYDGIRYGLREEGKDLLDVYLNSRTRGFGDEVKRRIMLGTYVLSSGYYDAYYGKACKVRRLITEDFRRVFAECDVILSPTSPTPAFKIGEHSHDPLAMYLTDIYTISANLAGIPAISFPVGFTKNNLPMGMQLMAKKFNETQLLQLVHCYQKETDWHTRIPETCTK